MIRLKTGLITALYCLFLGSLLLLHLNLSAQPNHYEEQLIQESILKDFHVMIDTWTEELYFEMYDFGSSQSKSIMSQGDFAQRMVDLKWKPAIKPLLEETVEIIYRNFAIIHFVQEFENKVNPTETVRKKMIFPAMMEKTGWKFDLTQLINVPYEGIVYEKTETITTSPDKPAPAEVSATPQNQPQTPVQATPQNQPQTPVQATPPAPTGPPGQATPQNQPGPPAQAAP